MSVIHFLFLAKTLRTNATPHPINIPRTNASSKVILGFGAVGYKLIVGSIYGSTMKYLPLDANISYCSSLLISSAKASLCSREREVRIFSL